MAALDALEREVAKELRVLAHETARRIQTEARGRVRRRTGRTADQITIDESGGAVRVVAWGDPANLPLWIEAGTVKQAAAPFLFNSARAEEGTFERRVAALLQKVASAVSR